MLVEKQQRPKHRGTGGLVYLRNYQYFDVTGARGRTAGDEAGEKGKVGHGRPKDLEFSLDSDRG